MTIVILGAGISGISAAYHLKQKGITYELYEARDRWGGLCDNFTVNGFRFDRFVHLSHTKDQYVQKLFSISTDSHQHPPKCSNYYHGIWLNHPAQYNLKPLSFLERIKVVKGFALRRKNKEPKNYDEWLRNQYGDYFTDHFPGEYTRKYWATEASKLRTEWVGVRMTTPGLRDVIRGSFITSRENHYYASEMRYPRSGGYRTYLNAMAAEIFVRTNHQVISIDPEIRTVSFKNETTTTYKNLVSSIPLPALCPLIKGCPSDVLDASKALNCTGGVLVSIGLSKSNLRSDLWFYIYDRDIIASRVYSPSLKSADNAPSGCSSLQAEIYFNNKTLITPERMKELESNTLESLLRIGIFARDEILFSHTRYEKYANVIFDEDIYRNRETIHRYLHACRIIPIGRFGEWDYLWSDQSLQSGKRAVDALLN